MAADSLPRLLPMMTTAAGTITPARVFIIGVGVAGLRRVNEVLLAPLLEGLDPSAPAIALMDATDLPAACRGFKKSPPAPIPPRTPRWVGARSRRAKAAVSSATKSTRCGYGSRLIRRIGCWCRWSVG